MISTLSQLDSRVLRCLKVLTVLLLGRVKRLVPLSIFLTLNPWIRKMMLNIFETFVKRIPTRKERRKAASLSNIISCGFLYTASIGNNEIAKDYWAMYLWSNYYAVLNKPSDSNIIVSPFSSVIKVKKRSEFVRKLYDNKEYIICPLVFAQILSNYLTPTNYRLNHRYLSSSIKRWVLNPIWINFSLTKSGAFLHWKSLVEVYLLHNLIAVVIVAVVNLKSRFLDYYYALKYHAYHKDGREDLTLTTLIKNYSFYVLQRANTWINFVYIPNLVSMFLIAISAPLLSLLQNSSTLWWHRFYMRHIKLLFKTYVKSVGFFAAILSLMLNARHSEDCWRNESETIYDDEDGVAPRYISKSWLKGLNLYMLRLIIMSKWRIVKENHPTFRKVKGVTWDRLETILFCLGIYKLMNLVDFFRYNSETLNASTIKNLRGNACTKFIEYIM